MDATAARGETSEILKSRKLDPIEVAGYWTRPAHSQGCRTWRGARRRLFDHQPRHSGAPASTHRNALLPRPHSQLRPASTCEQRPLAAPESETRKAALVHRACFPVLTRVTAPVMPWVPMAKATPADARTLNYFDPEWHPELTTHLGNLIPPHRLLDGETYPLDFT